MRCAFRGMTLAMFLAGSPLACAPAQPVGSDACGDSEDLSNPNDQQAYDTLNPAQKSRCRGRMRSSSGAVTEPISLPDQLAPWIEFVEPKTGVIGRSLDLILYGERFAPNVSQVKLGSVYATEVHFESEQKIRAHFAPEPGSYLSGARVPLLLENPDGGRSTRDDLFSFEPIPLPVFWGEPSAGGSPCGGRLGDFDGDGTLDVVTADLIGPAWITTYLMPPIAKGGIFPSGIKRLAVTDVTWKNPDPSDYPSFVDLVPGDFDEDGNLDVALAEGTTGIRYAWGDGTGRFSSWTRKTLGPSSIALAANDLNGDGHIDLLVADASSNQIAVLFGQGKREIPAPRYISAGSGATSLLLADINNDSKPDIVLANESANLLNILLGDGNGAFGEERRIATCTGPRAVASGNLDNNFQTDLAVSCPSSNGITLLFNVAQESINSKFISLGKQPYGITIADFDGDGREDIAIGTLIGKEISILLNQETKPIETAEAIPIQAGWSPRSTSPWQLSTGDINNDGKLDIITANLKSGSIGLVLSQPQ